MMRTPPLPLALSPKKTLFSTRQPLPWREPGAVAAALATHWGPEGLIWLDGDGSALGRWITRAADPLEQHCCRGLPGQAGASDPFAQLAQLAITVLFPLLAAQAVRGALHTALGALRPL